MHHPCFFDFFYSNHADDGFQLHGGPFFLFRSRDIASEPLDEFLAFQKDGIYYNNKPAPSNNCGKYRKLNYTTDTESQLDAKTDMPPCLQTAGGYSRKKVLCLGFRSGCLRQLYYKARGGRFGLSLFIFPE